MNIALAAATFFTLLFGTLCLCLQHSLEEAKSRAKYWEDTCWREQQLLNKQSMQNRVLRTEIATFRKAKP